MKKIFLSIIMMMMVLTLCACSKTEKTNDDNSNKTDNKETSKKFDDLTMTRRIGVFDDAWIDLPSWREDSSETCRVAERYNYCIIAVISDEDYSFDELFNNVAKSDLKHFVDRGTYEDFEPDTKEEVVLSTGINATKFEGTVKLEDYGDKYEYPAYGYYLKFNNYPIMVMSIETNTGSQLNSEEEWLNAKNYVDKAVQTIRTSE